MAGSFHCAPRGPESPGMGGDVTGFANAWPRGGERFYEARRETVSVTKELFQPTLIPGLPVKGYPQGQKTFQGRICGGGARKKSFPCREWSFPRRNDSLLQPKGLFPERIELFPGQKTFSAAQKVFPAGKRLFPEPKRSFPRSIDSLLRPKGLFSDL
jgi:hypothetical protein